jgi:hypothetical protein
MHASKLPLTIWFWAAFLMATHSNGISAFEEVSSICFITPRPDPRDPGEPV